MRSTWIGLYTLLGIITFFFCEKSISRLLHKKSGKETSHSHAHKAYESMSVACWLSLFAYFMHNFTDGIAIGTAFVSGRSMAVATTLSVFIHEIPHEVGDYTILISGGFSKWSAIKAQFATATAAFIGTFIGLAAMRSEALEEAFLAITAGGFIYVSTVGIMNMVVSHGPYSSLTQTTLEVLGFSFGVALMVAVAMTEGH